MQQLTFYPEPSKPTGKLIFSITVPGRLPSWNAILGMEHWARYQFKKQLADAFLYELRRSERDCSTKITSAKSTTLTYADTLAAYLTTIQAKRKLKSASKKRSLARRKKCESKSLNSETDDGDNKRGPVPF